MEPQNVELETHAFVPGRAKKHLCDACRLPRERHDATAGAGAPLDVDQIERDRVAVLGMSEALAAESVRRLWRPPDLGERSLYASRSEILERFPADLRPDVEKVLDDLPIGSGPDETHAAVKPLVDVYAARVRKAELELESFHAAVRAGAELAGLLAPRWRTDDANAAEILRRELGDAELGRELVAVLSEHCGETGENEGAVETLRRIVRERDARAVRVADRGTSYQVEIRQDGPLDVESLVDQFRAAIASFPARATSKEPGLLHRLVARLTQEAGTNLDPEAALAALVARARRQEAAAPERSQRAEIVGLASRAALSLARDVAAAADLISGGIRTTNVAEVAAGLRAADSIGATFARLREAVDLVDHLERSGGRS